MKISKNWLARHVDLDGITADQISEKLTLHTAEVEEIKKKYDLLDGVHAVEIKSVSKHPDAEKLVVAQIYDGKTTHQIVCGAKNCREGIIAAWVAPGGLARWHGKGEPQKIESAKLRGVDSAGMLAAGDEIGIADDKNPDGILELPADTKLGIKLSEIYTPDTIIDIDNKSCTHRPDLFCHRGFARELALIFNRPLREIKWDEVKSNEKYPITADENTVKRITWTKISGVNNLLPTPEWMTDDLTRIGAGNHGFLVDVTNFVMHDLGQPSHAFDADKVVGKPHVRFAKNGEKIKTLDKIDRELYPTDVIIADDDGPIALAGVMGGDRTAISDGTKNILLEVATWHPTLVRRTAQRHGLRSDSSGRYEKSLDTHLVPLARDALVAHLTKVFPTLKIEATDDKIFENTPENLKISISPDWIRAKTGDQNLTDDEMEKILVGLGFKVQK